MRSINGSMITVVFALFYGLTACQPEVGPKAETTAYRVPDSVITTFAHYRGGGDSLRPKSIGWNIFFFDYYPTESYPGDTAQARRLHPDDFFVHKQYVVQKLYDDVFSMMKTDFIFLESYRVGLLTHFKDLPDTGILAYWNMKDLAH